MKNNTLHFICEKGKDHFAQPILDKLDMKIVKRIGSNDLSHFINSFGAKKIWVEWANHPAIVVSKVKRPRQKLIIRLHRYEMYRKRWMRKIKWDNVDCVIFVNSELEREFKMTVSESVKTVTIPNAIVANQFPATEISGKNSLLTYGLQFERRKAYDKLVHMFKKVINKNSNFTLTIAGQAPKHPLHIEYFEKVKSLVRDLELTEKVNFKLLEIDENELKSHSNIKTLLATHNAIISYSDNESFHYTFAEGLLSGLQGFCRGWNELSLREFWGNWYFDNKRNMINGILKWGETPVEERQKIAKINRQYIVDNFSAEIIAGKYVEIFKNL